MEVLKKAIWDHAQLPKSSCVMSVPNHSDLSRLSFLKLLYLFDALKAHSPVPFLFACCQLTDSLRFAPKALIVGDICKIINVSDHPIMKERMVGSYSAFIANVNLNARFHMRHIGHQTCKTNYDFAVIEIDEEFQELGLELDDDYLFVSHDQIKGKVAKRGTFLQRVMGM